VLPFPILKETPAFTAAKIPKRSQGLVNSIPS
jgi:hypothetical protein